MDWKTFLAGIRWANIFVLCWVLVMAIVGWAARAKAHSWYPYNCCSNMDCGPVSDAVMRELPDGRGYLVIPTGEVISYKDGRVKGFSPDGEHHRCAVDGPTGKARTICIWPKGSGF